MSDLTHLGNGSNPDVIMVKNKVFASIKDSLVNLLVLLTSSNNPDGRQQQQQPHYMHLNRF